MPARLITLLLVVIVAASCDKVKSLAAKSSIAMKDKITGQADDRESSKVDAQLQQLVDQTAEGAVFRKDLPFPSHLEVTITRRHEMSGRFYQSSAIGKQADVLKGTQTTLTQFKRVGDMIRYTLEQADFALPVSDKPEAKQNTAPKATQAPSSAAQPVTFRKTGKSWGADQRGDFRAAALVQELAPVFDQLLIENALASRPLWFAKHRFKVGDPLVVTGDALPMLLAGNAKGSLTLKLESFEPVEGHPCGVFAISGDYTRKSFPDFEGRFIDEEVTIQSGKIWLSLVYPIILKEELDTIQSFKSGGRGGLVSRGQGSVKVSVKRVWKCLDP
ncbi:MAG: hypothetical protein NTV46_20970 [Verrucomicrobia bacterium]|nr:hypothetical protein [Verrucomicrobiota bacterium]